jgi:3-methyladenine DNA glycosylase AlkD
MPASRTAKPPTPKKARQGAKAATPAKASKTRRAAADAPRMSLAEAMKTLEKAGTAQARKTYARHGAREPLFGVSFATLGSLVKRIGVDHDLALGLWATGNFDARNLALKVVDPARMTPADLDRWASDMTVRMCAGYVSMVAAEGPNGRTTATRWLASKDERLRAAGWGLVAQLAARDEATPDAWFAERLAQVQASIQAAPNDERYAMNGAVIAIGGRSPALRKAALATARRVGPVEVDHGDTECRTPDAAAYIEKTWSYAKAKGFPSPSAQERTRESPRTRC